jgi:hypothetical protein
MKKLSLLIAAAGLTCAALAHAEDTTAQPAATPSGQSTANTSSMADLPAIKAEAERIAALMERLAKESDPAERRRIMAEVTCAQ